MLIPFEYHISVSPIDLGQIQKFTSLCESIGGKALIIELARGTSTTQPMLAKTEFLTSSQEALEISRDYAHIFSKSDFKVTRVKIEVPSQYAYDENAMTGSFNGYFEWHGKVVYERKALLLELCHAHEAHLSINSLKGNNIHRFVTMRHYGTKSEFSDRLSGLKKGLISGKWHLTKEESEFCVYDSNEDLDNGWLK